LAKLMCKTQATQTPNATPAEHEDGDAKPSHNTD
jgi:hypothetical protein